MLFLHMDFMERERLFMRVGSFVIFVCSFDLFGEGRHIYTFENRCIQNTELGLGDDTTKIILNRHNG